MPNNEYVFREGTVTTHCVDCDEPIKRPHPLREVCNACARERKRQWRREHAPYQPAGDRLCQRCGGVMGNGEGTGRLYPNLCVGCRALVRNRVESRGNNVRHLDLPPEKLWREAQVSPPLAECK